MAILGPKYSKREFAERGEAIYERDIAPLLGPGDDGELVAIDIETGQFELGTSQLDVCQTLRERVPDAQIWVRRVGSKYVFRFGGRRSRYKEGDN